MKIDLLYYSNNINVNTGKNKINLSTSFPKPDITEDFMRQNLGLIIKFYMSDNKPLIKLDFDVKLKYQDSKSNYGSELGWHVDFHRPRLNFYAT